MDRKALAMEMLAIAKELTAIDFPTQDAMDKYMKDHPDAERSNHKVVETKKEAPAKTVDELYRPIWKSRNDYDTAQHRNEHLKPLQKLIAEDPTKVAPAAEKYIKRVLQDARSATMATYAIQNLLNNDVKKGSGEAKVFEAIFKRIDHQAKKKFKD